MLNQHTLRIISWNSLTLLATANAIFRATGVRIKDLPLTPERVWRALREAGVTPGDRK